MSQGWLETFGVPQSPDEIVQLYNANAKIYDDHMNKQSYTAYVRAAEVLKKLKSDTTSRILDLCAGTGLVGLALYNHGFRHIHGHDGSGEMIKIAASRNVYEKLYEELLHVDRETKFLPQNYFDAVITCGSLLPGHLTVDHIPMMTTLIKDDGIVVILTRKQSFYPYSNASKVEKEFQLHTQSVFSSFVSNGTCRLVYEEFCLGYSHDCEGIILVLAKGN